MKTNKTAQLPVSLLQVELVMNSSEVAQDVTVDQSAPAVYHTPIDYPSRSWQGVANRPAWIQSEGMPSSGGSGQGT